MGVCYLYFVKFVLKVIYKPLGLINFTTLLTPVNL